MKDQEERELNGEVTSNAEESPGEEVTEEKGATSEEQEVLLSGLTDHDEEPTADSLPNKESQPCDTAQGALGQVKAKVEVCKDESIGKGFSKTD